jgi:hypothetical protein
MRILSLWMWWKKEEKNDEKKKNERNKWCDEFDRWRVRTSRFEFITIDVNDDWFESTDEQSERLFW